MELMDAVDKYIPDSQPEMDQGSSIHTKFTAEVYMLDINEVDETQDTLMVTVCSFISKRQM